MTTRSSAAFHPSADLKHPIFLVRNFPYHYSPTPIPRHPDTFCCLNPGCFLVALLLWACCRAVAAENSAVHAGVLQAELNLSKCAVHFTLGAFLHTVDGTFKVNAGTIRFDPSSDHLTGQISVDVKSGQTGNGIRDRQMHENVLESNRYPEAVFTLSYVQGRLALDGESHVDLRGMLRIHGAEHELTVPATIKVRHDIVTATADFTVPYVAWGMKDPSNLLLRVDKTVSVHVELNGAVKAAL
jgi:polyisoprenoid-binding protein YceI